MQAPYSTLGSRASNKQARAQQTVLERRACDVLVLGDSALAYASSLSLARRGKKVIHIPDMGLVVPPAMAQKRPEAMKPLLLLDTQPQLASMASDAAQYFDGLELQSGVPLIVRSKSVDMAVTQGYSKDMQISTSLMSSLMTTLVDVSKQSGIKVKPITSLSDMPLLKVAGNMTAVVQSDGGVINSVRVTGALRTLAKRTGVLQRDEIVLTGWQDTGSCLRVRASSRLQTDITSLFEAERVLLAPGAWAGDCFKLWGLDLQLKLRARPSLRCTSSPDLSNMPLVRYWQAPSLETAATTSTTSTTSSGSSKSQRNESGRQQQPRPSNESKVVGGVQGRSDDVSGVQGHDISHWMMFPRLGASGTCKLTGLATTNRQLSSCWELLPAITGARSTGDPEARVKGGGDSVQDVLVNEWQEAEGLVRGLGRPLGWRREDEEEEEEDPGARGEQGGEDAGRGAKEAGVHTAWDVVSPDGLPVLGWHPGFESGRVLVACVAGSAPGVMPTHGEAVASVAEGKGGGGEGGGGASAEQQLATWQEQQGGQGEASGRGQRNSGQKGREEEGEKVVKGRGEEGELTVEARALHDGWHLSPLLAKAAADMLMGVVVVDMPVDVATLEPSRPALWSPGGAQGDGIGEGDPWESLGDVQTGVSFYRRVQAGMSEEERQEEEEAEFAQARGLKK